MPWLLSAPRFECTLKIIGFNFEYIRFKIFEILKIYLVNGLRCGVVLWKEHFGCNAKDNGDPSILLAAYPWVMWGFRANCHRAKGEIALGNDCKSKQGDNSFVFSVIWYLYWFSLIDGADFSGWTLCDTAGDADKHHQLRLHEFLISV